MVAGSHYPFAIETGMRRSKIVNVKSADVDLEAMTLRIPRTKNNHSSDYRRY